jgi:hypothetical protein
MESVMTSPLLQIKRIVVEGDYSFDQRFSSGFNVIHAVQIGDDPRSSNSCGKTSLVELIQYGFGKTHDSKAKFFFAPIIDHLKTLWLEFETQNGVFTIERSLQAITANAHLFEGPYYPGISASPSEIVSIDEMSNLLLDLVGIPKVSVNTMQGESTPLSFRLLMRAFILHQEDSFNEILFKVLPETRKADIIGFLTGITPMERFPLENLESELKADISPLVDYIKQVKIYLTENNIPSVVEIVGLVEKTKGELNETKQKLHNLQYEIGQQKDQERPGFTDVLRQQLIKLKDDISRIELDIASCKHDENRLSELLGSLNNDKKKAIHIQSSTAQLSSVEFVLCPRCLQEITSEMKLRESTGRCSVCNRPFIVSSDSLPRRLVKTDDIDLQIKETKDLLERTQIQIQRDAQALLELQDKEKHIGNELEKELSVYVTPSVDQILVQANEIAERQSALDHALSLLEQVQGFENKQANLEDLRLDLAKVQDKLNDARRASKERRELLIQTFQKVIKAVDYPGVNEISIGAESLMPMFDGLLYTHQGTALKGLATVCYHLALLSLARKVDTWFPKFLVVDSPNTGDLNEDNHKKLLDYLAALQTESAEEDIDWQIILTTRFLPVSLEPYVKEVISNPDKMLLRKRNPQSAT